MGVIAAAQAVQRRSLTESIRDYLALTKPRIMSLLLLTGVAGAFVGARGVPSATVLAATVVGLAFACGGASALNHVLDRDIDRLMGDRTCGRPVASARVSAEHAREFGVALSALSFIVLAVAVNVLAAVLALVGGLFYVLVYTRLLKRRTVQNIVIGGAAGAVPPVVGYAAASGTVGLPAIWLFLVVFLWTPPHFWALALLLKEHYAAAKIPMMPVVRGVRATVAQIVVYSLALVSVTLVPVAVGTLGDVYLVGAVVLDALFVALAIQLWRDATRARSARLFHFSLLYLALLFVLIAVDVSL